METTYTRDLKWFALRVSPQKEKIATIMLRHKGFDVRLPVEEKWRKANRFTKQRRKVSFPLAYGYIFVGFGKGREVPWHDILNLHFVKGVIGYQGRPFELSRYMRPKDLRTSSSRTDADWLAGVCQDSEFTARPEQRGQRTYGEFAEGDVVQLVTGGFDGFRGKVISVSEADAVILLTMFGGEREVKISPDMAVKAA